MERKHDANAEPGRKSSINRSMSDIVQKRGSFDDGDQRQQKLDEQSTALEQHFKSRLRRYHDDGVKLEQYKITVEVLLRGGTRHVYC